MMAFTSIIGNAIGRSLPLHSEPLFTRTSLEDDSQMSQILLMTVGKQMQYYKLAS
jgi:hypothetical protein